MPPACSTERAWVDGLRAREGATGPMGSVEGSAVGSVGGRSVLLWSTSEGAVEVRVAPLKELAAAPVNIVFDGAVHDGVIDGAKAVKNLRLVTYERFGVLLLELPGGTHAFRLDADGKVAPLKLD